MALLIGSGSVRDLFSQFNQNNSKAQAALELRRKINPNDPNNRPEKNLMESSLVKLPRILSDSNINSKKLVSLIDNQLRGDRDWQRQNLNLMTRQTTLLGRLLDKFIKTNQANIGSKIGILDYTLLGAGLLKGLGVSSLAFKTPQLIFKGIQGLMNLVPRNILTPIRGLFLRIGKNIELGYDFIKGNIPSWIKDPALKIIGKIYDFIKPGVTFIKGIFSPLIRGFEGVVGILGPIRALAPRITAFLGRGAKLLGKIFWPITAIMGIVDAFQGWNNAGEILGLKEGEEASLKDKIIASVGSVVNGLLMGIPNWISEKFGFGNFSQLLNEGINQLINDPLGAIMDLVTSPIRYLNDGIEYIKNLFPSWETIKTDWLGIGKDSIWNSVADVITWPARNFDAVINFINDLMPTWSTIKTFVFGDSSEPWYDRAFKVITAPQRLIWEYIGLLGEAVDNIGNKIYDMLPDIGLERLLKNIGNSVTSFVDALQYEAIRVISKNTIDAGSLFGETSLSDVNAAARESLLKSDIDLEKELRASLKRSGRSREQTLDSFRDIIYASDLSREDAIALYRRYAQLSGNVEIQSQANDLKLAQGGIVTGPSTIVGAKNIALMGESGPEAVMPLARLSDGSLGIRAINPNLTSEEIESDIVAIRNRLESPAQRLMAVNENTLNWIDKTTPSWNEIVQWYDIPTQNSDIKSQSMKILTPIFNRVRDLKDKFLLWVSGNNPQNYGENLINSAIPRTDIQNTTSNSANGISGTNIDWNSIVRTEGYKQTSYTLDPKNFGLSGVTIGVGVDLGTKDEKFLRNSGISEQSIEQLKPFLGLKGNAAVSAHNRLGAVTLPRSEIDQLNSYSQSYLLTPFINYWNSKSSVKFNQLPSQIQTVLAQRAWHWGPYFYNSKPHMKKFFNLAVQGKWKEAGQFLMNLPGNGGVKKGYQAQGRILMQASETENRGINTGAIIQNSNPQISNPQIAPSFSSGFSAPAMDLGSGIQSANTNIPAAAPIPANANVNNAARILNQNVNGSFYTGPENFRSQYGYSWNDFKNSGKMGGPGRLDPKVIRLLDYISARTGRKYNIVSAYRSPEYNRSVEGAKNSYHSKGQALDVSMEGLNQSQKEAFVKAAGEAGVGGISYYTRGNFTHIDTGNRRVWNKGIGWFDKALNEGYASGPNNSTIQSPIVGGFNESGENKPNTINAVATPDMSVTSGSETSPINQTLNSSLGALAQGISSIRNTYPDYNSFVNSNFSGSTPSISNILTNTTPRRGQAVAEIQNEIPTPANVQTGPSPSVIDNPVKPPVRQFNANPVAQSISGSSNNRPTVQEMPVVIDDLGLILLNSRMLG